jgi:hypothetical protein
MTLATLRPGRLRRHYAGLDAVHYPLTIALPTLELPTVVTVHDLSISTTPSSSREPSGSGGRDARALRPECG